jgi:hypothetical protein
VNDLGPLVNAVVAALNNLARTFAFHFAQPLTNRLDSLPTPAHGLHLSWPESGHLFWHSRIRQVYTWLVSIWEAHTINQIDALKTGAFPTIGGVPSLIIIVLQPAVDAVSVLKILLSTRRIY